MLQYKSSFALSLIFAFYILLSFLFNHFVYTDDFYLTSLSGQLNTSRINDLLNNQKKTQWIGYIFIPIGILIKLLLLSTWVYIIFLLNNLKLSWKIIFRIGTEAEAVFLIPAILKLIWFSLSPPETFQQISDFAPWSLAVLAGENTPVYLKYVLQTINVFEIIYWILLATGIRSATQFSFSKSLGIVAKSYGIGLALWIVFVTFILVQIS